MCMCVCTHFVFVNECVHVQMYDACVCVSLFASSLSIVIVRVRAINFSKS